MIEEPSEPVSIEPVFEPKKVRNYFSRLSCWLAVLYITVFNIIGIIIGFIIIIAISSFSLSIDLTDLSAPSTLYITIAINALAIIGMGGITFLINRKTPHLRISNQKLNKIDWKIFGIAFAATLALIGSCQLLVSYLLNNVWPEQNVDNPYDFFNSDKIGVIIFAIILVTFFAPIVEELFYRWTMIESLKQGLGKTATILFSALIFSLAHSLADLSYSFTFFVIHLIVTFLLGIILGYVYYQTNKVIITILIHGLWNLIIASSVLFDFWSIGHLFTIIFTVIVCACSLFLVVYFIIYFVKKRKKVDNKLLEEEKEIEIKKPEKMRLRFYGAWFELVLVYLLVIVLVPNIIGVLFFGEILTGEILQFFYFAVITLIGMIIILQLRKKSLVQFIDEQLMIKENKRKVQRDF
jgi:membrane protease YdiL (CAAX protease family)